MNIKAKELEKKAKVLRRQQKIKKRKQALSNKSSVPEPILQKFIIHARARRPVVREDKTLIDAMKWILSQIPKDDLYEVHDSKDRLLWGRSTGLNKDLFTELQKEK